MSGERIVISEALKMLNDFGNNIGKRGRHQNMAAREDAASMRRMLNNQCCADCANLTLKRVSPRESVLPIVVCAAGINPVEIYNNLGLIEVFNCVSFTSKTSTPASENAKVFR